MVTSASTVSTVYWFHTKRPPPHFTTKLRPCPRTFGIQNGAMGYWADALYHARKPKPSSDPGFVIWQRPQIMRIFQQLSLMLKT